MPDAEKLAFAGLIGAAGEIGLAAAAASSPGCSASRSRSTSSSACWLAFEPADRTRLGRRHSALGVDALLGASVFSVQDKFRVRIFAETSTQYRALPADRATAASRWPMRCSSISATQLDWDVELALPAGAVEPVRLGRFGAARLDQLDGAELGRDRRDASRRDARFHPAERMRRKRERVAATAGHGG